MPFRDLPKQCQPDPEVLKRRIKVGEMQRSGMKLREVAEELSITLSTAKSDASRARYIND